MCSISTNPIASSNQEKALVCAEAASERVIVRLHGSALELNTRELFVVVRSVFLLAVELERCRVRLAGKRESQRATWSTVTSSNCFSIRYRTFSKPLALGKLLLSRFMTFGLSNVMERPKKKETQRKLF